MYFIRGTNDLWGSLSPGGEKRGANDLWGGLSRITVYGNLEKMLLTHIRLQNGVVISTVKNGKMGGCL
jgi:hypothetical protein